MSQLNFRITGDSNASSRILNAMRAIDGVEHAEEIDDLMADRRQEDSSSAGLAGDTGPGSHVFVIETDTNHTANVARLAAEKLANGEGVALEFTEPQ